MNNTSDGLPLKEISGDNHSSFSPGCGEICGLHYRSKEPIKIVMENGRIKNVEIERGGHAGHYLLAPGLTDLQVNGFRGIDLNTPPLDPNKVRDLVTSLWKEGVTTFYPTIITNSDDNISQAVGAIAEACSRYPEAAMSIGGIHLEGPFISTEDGARGAHPVSFVRPPDIGLFSRWQQAANGLIKIVTLSPEWPESAGFIQFCHNRGMVAAIGHTAASPEMIRDAVNAGASLSTHLGNASHAMIPRHKNYIWEQLAADSLFISIIADGFHLPDAMLRVFIKVKEEKVFLVSDSTNFTGISPGNYSSHIGGDVTLTSEGKLHLKGNPDILAGSGRSLIHCVNTLIRKNLVSPVDAWEMASIRPLAFIHHDKPTSFEPGSMADIVLLESNQEGFKVIQTIKAGRRVF